MGIVAIDSSGSFEQPPIRIVAAKKVEKQNYRALYLDEGDIEKYRKIIQKKMQQNKGKKKKKNLKKLENYREKISAALIFESMRTLVKHTDLIQIDKDFEGWREDMVRGFLERLFGKVHYGTPLSNPKIRFITDHCDEGKYIKEAHGKTQDAKHKKLDAIEKCPNLEKLLDFL